MKAKVKIILFAIAPSVLSGGCAYFNPPESREDLERPQGISTQVSQGGECLSNSIVGAWQSLQGIRIH